MFNKGLNGFQVKMLAVIFMTMDHIHYAFTGVFEVPEILSILGRIAAPLFIFMVTEGMRHTRNREKYLLRLWTGSVFMGLVNPIIDSKFPMANGGVLIANIFSTLFIICLIIYGIDKARNHLADKNITKAIGYGVLALLPVVGSGLILSLLNMSSDGSLLWLVREFLIFVPTVIFTEGSFVFVLLGLGFYWLGKNKTHLCGFYLLFSLAFLVLNQGGNQWFQVLALPILYAYNADKGPRMKYFFYIYYPVHLYGLLVISYFISK